MKISFEDKYRLGGWLDIDATREAPYGGTLVEELRRAIELEGRIGTTVNPYIICSLFTSEVFGYSLDEKGTRSRLLGTVVNDQPVVFFYGGNSSISFVNSCPVCSIDFISLGLLIPNEGAHIKSTTLTFPSVSFIRYILI